MNEPYAAEIGFEVGALVSQMRAEGRQDKLPELEAALHRLYATPGKTPLDALAFVVVAEHLLCSMVTIGEPVAPMLKNAILFTHRAAEALEAATGIGGEAFTGGHLAETLN